MLLFVSEIFEEKIINIRYKDQGFLGHVSHREREHKDTMKQVIQEREMESRKLWFILSVSSNKVYNFNQVSYPYILSRNKFHNKKKTQTCIPSTLYLVKKFICLFKKSAFQVASISETRVST